MLTLFSFKEMTCTITCFFLLGLTPLLAMIILILKVKMPIHYSVLSTLLLTLILEGFSGRRQLWIWDLLWYTAQSKVCGTIVIVILAAIYSYNLMNATKSMDILRNVLASVSDDKRIQGSSYLMVFWRIS